MISRLLSRWIKPPFYVCEWSDLSGMYNPQTFACIGYNRDGAMDDAYRVLASKVCKGQRAIYQVRQATLRERLK